MLSNAGFAIASVVELGIDVYASYLIVQESQALRQAVPTSLQRIQQHIDAGKEAAEDAMTVWKLKGKFRFDLYTTAAVEFDAAVVALDLLLTSLGESQEKLRAQEKMHAVKAVAAGTNVVLTAVQFTINPLLGTARLLGQVALGGFTVAAAGHGLAAYFTHEEVSHVPDTYTGAAYPRRRQMSQCQWSEIPLTVLLCLLSSGNKNPRVYRTGTGEAP